MRIGTYPLMFIGGYMRIGTYPLMFIGRVYEDWDIAINVHR